MSTIKVTWITADGQHIEAAVAVGHNLMEAALANNVPGVVGECGGALACATCHVVVQHSPVALPSASAMETEMLEMAQVPPTPDSRLSCQIEAQGPLSGIVLRVPGPGA